MKKILGLKNIDIFSIAAIIFLSMIALFVNTPL